MATIVILGAGIGGVSIAFELKKLLGSNHQLILINEKEHFEFTPSNPWVAVGWRTAEQITVNLTAVLEKQNIMFIHKMATKLDALSNQITLDDSETIEYDYMVIATGPKLAFNEIEGLGPDGFSTSICQTSHAQNSWQNFEAFSADPGPIVVGAAQGASCFGPAYEYALIVDTELRKRKIRDKVPMTFVTPEPYIGHLGLDGVGDTKGMLESELRNRHIHWITNAKIDRLEQNNIAVTQVNEDGKDKRQHKLPFKHCMILPAFKGVDLLSDIEGLVNPRGFVLVDEYQRNPKFNNIYSVGVCIAIPPVAQTPLPVGVPKTGFMIESMVTAAAENISNAIKGIPPTHQATWNALCLADFGDRGVAFAAMPQIPPRNVNWASKGKWVHFAKIGFEKYFIHKVRHARSETFYEKQILKWMGADKLKQQS